MHVPHLTGKGEVAPPHHGLIAPQKSMPNCGNRQTPQPTLQNRSSMKISHRPQGVTTIPLQATLESTAHTHNGAATTWQYLPPQHTSLFLASAMASNAFMLGNTTTLHPCLPQKNFAPTQLPAPATTDAPQSTPLSWHSTREHQSLHPMQREIMNPIPGEDFGEHLSIRTPHMSYGSCPHRKISQTSLAVFPTQPTHCRNGTCCLPPLAICKGNLGVGIGHDETLQPPTITPAIMGSKLCKKKADLCFHVCRSTHVG